MAYFHTEVLDNQIKALPTVSTASGSVATFDTDLTENLIECVCEVTNASQIMLVRTDKNYFNSTGSTPNQYLDVDGNPQSANGWTYSDYCLVLPNTEYTFTTNSSAGAAPRHCFYDENMSFISAIATANNSITFTTPNNAKYMRFSYRTASTDLQLEFGAESTTYNSFVNYYTINLGGTYTGTVDVVTGKIVDTNDDIYYASNIVEIPTLNGTNKIMCDTGDTEVKYLLTVGKKIS